MITWTIEGNLVVNGAETQVNLADEEVLTDEQLRLGMEKLIEQGEF